MLNVTWPAAAHIASHKLAIEAHSRGGEGRGGHYNFERGPGARWRGSLEVAPMRIADALTFRAFLHSLRGRSGTFLLRVPHRFTTATTYTDGTYFGDDTYYSDYETDDGTLTAAAVSGAATITVSSTITASVLTVVGASVVIGDIATTGQLLRIVSISGSTLTIRPRLRAAYAIGTAVTVGRVLGKFRLDMDTPAIPLDGRRSQAVEIQIAEAY